MNTLVVTNPFGGKQVGDRITDPTAIGEILAGEHAHHVVQSHHADVHAAEVALPIVPAAGPDCEETQTEEA